jgi:hypothetical protein
MKVNFIYVKELPTELLPGGIYFVESEGAIYVASSDTNVTKYSAYKELENKQEVIEDLEEIRTGVNVIENMPVTNSNDIDNLFI